MITSPNFCWILLQASCVCTHLHTCTYMHVHIHIYVCIHSHVHIYVFIYLCVHIYICLYMCIFIYNLLVSQRLRDKNIFLRHGFALLSTLALHSQSSCVYFFCAGIMTVYCHTWLKFFAKKITFFPKVTVRIQHNL